jgi:hypothetical protein
MLLFLICVLAFVMCLAILGFFMYHVTLIIKGQTTNESYKWENVFTFHSKLVIAHTNYLQASEEEKVADLPYIYIDTTYKY